MPARHHNPAPVYTVELRKGFRSGDTHPSPCWTDGLPKRFTPPTQVQVARHPFDGTIDLEITGFSRSVSPFRTSVCSVVGHRSPVFALLIVGIPQVSVEAGRVSVLATAVEGSPLDPHGEDFPRGSVGAHLQHCEPHSPVSQGLHLYESSL